MSVRDVPCSCTLCSLGICGKPSASTFDPFTTPRVWGHLCRKCWGGRCTLPTKQEWKKALGGKNSGRRKEFDTQLKVPMTDEEKGFLEVESARLAISEAGYLRMLLSVAMRINGFKTDSEKINDESEKTGKENSS